MAGRRTFFSFHYQRDIWRVNVVRKAGVVDAQAAAGWEDASLWEKAKRESDAAVKRLIDAGLQGTSVTVVLIGAKTSTRRWVDYEIAESIKRGNGVLGVYIHTIRDLAQNPDVRGDIPQGLRVCDAPCYAWDRDLLSKWVEKAAVKAGHPCLAHSRRACRLCG